MPMPMPSMVPTICPFIVGRMFMLVGYFWQMTLFSLVFIVILKTRTTRNSMAVAVIPPCLPLSIYIYQFICTSRPSAPVHVSLCLLCNTHSTCRNWWPVIVEHWNNNYLTSMRLHRSKSSKQHRIFILYLYKVDILIEHRLGPVPSQPTTKQCEGFVATM